MNQIKRILPFLLCAAILVCSAACNGNESTEPTQLYTTAAQPSTVKMGKGNLSLGFSSSDSLNPYTAVTAGNQQLSSLLFDGLVRLDENLNPQNAIAQSIKVDGKTVLITLKSVTFSDGSAISAEDVTYSIRLARGASNGLYKSQLENIYSYNAASSNEVEIILNNYDRSVASILDFPIIKRGSTDRKNNDSKQLPPIGAGRYIYNDDHGVYTLTGNSNYYSNVPQNTIQLVNMPDTAALQYGIRAGEVDIYYSGLSTGDLPSMSGSISMVKQTNLVFLGLNSVGTLRSKYIRQAVSALVNRSDICKKAYYTYAEPAISLFPQTLALKNGCADIFTAKANTEKAVEALTKAGYTNTDKNGYRTTKSGNHITLNLLYNNQNTYQKDTAQLLQRQLKSGGIQLKLDGRSFSVYSSLVSSGSYELYLGEIKLNKNFDFTSLFNKKLNMLTRKPTTAKTDANEQDDENGDYDNDENADDEQQTTTAAKTTKATTVSPAYKYVDIAGVYSSYLRGKITAKQLLDQFADQLPFIPIGYRLGVVSCNKTVTPKAVSTISDAYYNIEMISIK